MSGFGFDPKDYREGGKEFNEGGNYYKLPDGIHLAKCLGTEAPDDKCWMRVDFEVQNGKDKGQEFAIFYNLFHAKEVVVGIARQELVELTDALGVNSRDAMRGKLAMVTKKTNTSKKNGKVYENYSWEAYKPEGGDSKMDGHMERMMGEAPPDEKEDGESGGGRSARGDRWGN